MKKIFFSVSNDLISSPITVEYHCPSLLCDNMIFDCLGVTTPGWRDTLSKWLQLQRCLVTHHWRLWRLLLYYMVKLVWVWLLDLLNLISYVVLYIVLPYIVCFPEALCRKNFVEKVSCHPQLSLQVSYHLFIALCSCFPRQRVGVFRSTIFVALCSSCASPIVELVNWAKPVVKDFYSFPYTYLQLLDKTLAL